MRVLYAFPESLPFERARSFQAIRTASALADSGVKVVLMYPPGGSDPFSIYGLRRSESLSVVPIHGALHWPLSHFRSNLLFARRVIRKMRDMPAFDVVFARHLKFSAKFLENGPSVPLVYEAHEVFADTAPAGKRKKRQIEEKGVIARAAAIIANSGATANRLKELYGGIRRIEIIPNAVDRPDQIPEKDWSNARRKIIYAGSLFTWKGVDDLIAAGAWLPGYLIEIVGGDDVQIARLRAKIPASGAEFSFLGRLSQGEVMARLRANCVAVLPNRNDPDSAFTSPIKLFEYMASGCAVVASDLPPLREILGEKDAVWSPPGDPESLARAIALVASNPGLGAMIGARVYEMSKGHSWLSRGERLMTLFESVIGQ